MVNDEKNLVLPGTFIPSAERYGLMPAIDRWVIRQTFCAMSTHDIQGMQITINLSGNSLDDENLLGYVLEQLNEFSILPEQICFEITETAAIQHLSKAQKFIQAFRARGGKIALDDFGSGFSSFRYLRTLTVDYLKIDGDFVSDMLSNPSDHAMVEAITQMAPWMPYAGCPNLGCLSWRVRTTGATGKPGDSRATARSWRQLARPDGQHPAHPEGARSVHTD
jgi:EAL domain-containing protein (putative c-di-GMP-specific phosphodiesterase class I)